MAEHVHSNRPMHPRPVERMKGVVSYPSSHSKAVMAAQKAVMKSIEESVAKIKAERERFFRDRKNNQE